ncbi:unnamed protein product [Mytilus coruscus]|uniref:Uncharacterized protein n=1 Tax=Mytilus coruscus TaxID=42192 RepID=A0A6J8A5H5_MYTCO|nr:unnamed protein product [Mytilus coruscus]
MREGLMAKSCQLKGALSTLTTRMTPAQAVLVNKTVDELIETTLQMKVPLQQRLQEVTRTDSKTREIECKLKNTDNKLKDTHKQMADVKKENFTIKRRLDAYESEADFKDDSILFSSQEVVSLAKIPKVEETKDAEILAVENKVEDEPEADFTDDSILFSSQEVVSFAKIPEVEETKVAEILAVDNNVGDVKDAEILTIDNTPGTSKD